MDKNGKTMCGIECRDGERACGCTPATARWRRQTDLGGEVRVSMPMLYFLLMLLSMMALLMVIRCVYHGWMVASQSDCSRMKWVWCGGVPIGILILQCTSSYLVPVLLLSY